MNTVPISVQELKQFHTIDRDINFITHLLSMPSLLLNSIALETITCIFYLDHSSILSLSVKVVGIPFLQHIINNNTFSIPYLIDNRATVLESMQKISDTVCSRVFDDLLSQILLPRHQYQTHGSMFHSRSLSSSSSDDRVQHLMGGMEPRRNNIVGISKDPREQDIITVDQTLLVTEPTVSPRSRMGTQHERIVFLTFSKGYHVTETQLRDFFVGRFGEIIEDLIMQYVPLEEQPLYARMIVHSSNEVETVLGGQSRVRFTVNGKHVYARKFVQRNSKASTSSSSHQHSPPPDATTSD
ncbi:uncharacterized protein LOC124929617 [Impatiens glandulifera]|uniref:uncharacterized protein LOC124929617 n=1 Tax=Impatiens glandulifera TaxID=253017 RepID=UPI001FB0FEF6|nr:uncharacterized protein LOC124929617 [Impatiens glandulifera]